MSMSMNGPNRSSFGKTGARRFKEQDPRPTSGAEMGDTDLFVLALSPIGQAVGVPIHRFGKYTRGTLE